MVRPIGIPEKAQDAQRSFEQHTDAESLIDCPARECATDWATDTSDRGCSRPGSAGFRSSARLKKLRKPCWNTKHRRHAALLTGWDLEEMSFSDKKFFRCARETSERGRPDPGSA